MAFILAVLVVGFWKREELTRLWAIDTIFDEYKIVDNFSHMNAAFLTAPCAAPTIRPRSSQRLRP